MFTQSKNYRLKLHSKVNLDGTIMPENKINTPLEAPTKMFQNEFFPFPLSTKLSREMGFKNKNISLIYFIQQIIAKI